MNSRAIAKKPRHKRGFFYVVDERSLVHRVEARTPSEATLKVARKLHA